MHIDPSLKLEAPPWEMLHLLVFGFYKRKELSFYIDCYIGVLLSVTLKDSSLLLTQILIFLYRSTL